MAHDVAIVDPDTDTNVAVAVRPLVPRTDAYSAIRKWKQFTVRPSRK